jgi:hypothetical protein
VSGLWVSRGLGVELTEPLEIVDGKLVSEEM